MNKPSKSKYYFYFSLICAIWFMLTSFLWVYFANFFISFPVGLIGLYLWKKGKKIDPGNNRFKITAWVLLIGVGLSIAVLIGFLISALWQK